MRINLGGKTPRHISAREAAALVQSGDWLEFGTTVNQPDMFDAALAARAAELHDVKIRSCISVRPRAVLEADPDGAHFQWLSWHFSAYDRRKHDAGISHYSPCNLGEVPRYYRENLPPIDLVVLKTRPMDANGLFNFSVMNGWNRAVVERARKVLVEVNPHLPEVFGDSVGVHAGEVDFVIEGDGRPTPELPNTPPSEVDRAVGRLIVAQIEDGACLQIGIGAMPNAVCARLIDSPVRDLGVHSEMVMEGLLPLYRAGRLEGRRKTLYPGKIVYTFALGSAELYAAIHRNPDFREELSREARATGMMPRL